MILQDFFILSERHGAFIFANKYRNVECDVSVLMKRAIKQNVAPRSLSPTRAPAPKRDTLVRNKTNHGRAISKFSIVMELLKLFKRNN